ncbi:hypothetical protein EJ02DRAFT_503708 [Clathrospora elynae]|uniref:Uncharacterized protein n=1 Tax=Clathrospora elynae TaxID=706981 RepID=A0A6A5SNB8_9PLEO|nr:hypothetical protein EJ02DRAFT_503708 [Clathrospora elynae]
MTETNLSDVNKIAQQAEKELNSTAAVHGHSGSDSTRESGVDQSVENKFPGAKVTYGSAASGQGNNREIPLSEGGDIKANGQPTKAGDFARGGVGAPEARDQKYVETHGGDDEIRGNVRN